MYSILFIIHHHYQKKNKGKKPQPSAPMVYQHVTRGWKKKISNSLLTFFYIPFLLTSPIAVFFWGWKPEFLIKFGEWDLTTWSVVVSLVLTWLGHFAIRYWTITEQDKLGFSKKKQGINLLWKVLNIFSNWGATVWDGSSYYHCFHLFSTDVLLVF